jgi:calcineurin-like phosphoesterase family protein
MNKDKKVNPRIFVTSDHHFGHENILKFTNLRKGPTIEDHNEWLVVQHNSVVLPTDIVYFLGDVGLATKHLHYLHRMNGQKFLVRGNHDTGLVEEYLKYFSNVYGIIRKEHFWLSHAPIHPNSLRNGYNIHGHTHQNVVTIGDTKVPDDRYICVCIEQTNGVPVALADLRKKYPKPLKETK